MTRRLAWIPLAVGVGGATAACEWLRRAGEKLGRPVPAAPVFGAFAACFVLAILAARLAGPEPAEAPEPTRPREPLSGVRALVVIALGLASLALFAATWVLQGSLRSPVGAIAAWAGSLTLGAAAVAAAFPESRLLHLPPSPLLVAVLLVIALGGAARIAGLDAVPPGLGGDEANQILDATGLLEGTVPGDPFGAGWYGTMRLGMVPAGVGALASADPVAGPRLPYAIAGTLSVAGAAAAAGIVAGGWAALGPAVLLAAAPHHVHFSRLASVMILDSLAAAAFLIVVFRTRRSGAPRDGFVAGVVAGLALYGYSAGRVLPVLLVV